ncbi:hypothetical protein STSO111631_08400 [Stackebrandtia soli]
MTTLLGLEPVESARRGATAATVVGERVVVVVATAATAQVREALAVVTQVREALAVVIDRSISVGAAPLLGRFRTA